MRFALASDGINKCFAWAFRWRFVTFRPTIGVLIVFADILCCVWTNRDVSMEFFEVDDRDFAVSVINAYSHAEVILSVFVNLITAPQKGSKGDDAEGDTSE